MSTAYTSSDIKTAEGLTHVRRHPGMYDFDIHSMSGQFQMFKEPLDNSVDEATISPNKHHEINITFIKLKDTYQVIVQDCGRGVPLDKLVSAFGVLGTSGKWGGAYSASIGTYGIGVKATAALSKYFCAVSKRRDGMAIVVLKEGVVIHNAISSDKPDDRSTDGTTIFYEPDSVMLAGTDKFFDDGNGYTQALELLDFLSVFVPNVTFKVWVGNKKIADKQLIMGPEAVWDVLRNANATLVYTSKTGIDPSAYLVSKAGITAPIVWKSEIFSKELIPHNPNDVFGYHIEFFLTKDCGKRSGSILSAVNMTKISDKTAVQIAGLYNVLKKYLIQFVEDSDIREFFDGVYRIPINAIIMVKYHGATFIGQGKNNFTDRTFLRLYTEHLQGVFKAKPTLYWEELFSIIAEDVEDQYHKYVNKDIKLGAGLKNMALDLNNPSAYVGCRSTDRNVTELFITEGNSAGDFVKQLRNTNNQAVFKLRGKPLNPFKCDAKRLHANTVYQDLKQVLGTSVNDRTLENLNFFRIIILTDADSDGYHIAALLVGILHKINPMILETGRVLLSNPPLYVLHAKNETLFVLDKKGLMDTKVTMYEEALSIEVVSSSGGRYVLNGPSFRDMCYMVTHVGRIFSNVANKLVIDEEILEMMVHCIDFITPHGVDTTAIALTLGLDHCILQTESNSIILNSGGVEISVSLNNLVSEIRAYILPELQEMRWADIQFLVTSRHSPVYRNTPVTLTQLYKLFEVMDKFFQVSRMKGLGEMNGAQLTETCIDPRTRSFTTIRSTGNVDEIYNLLGVDTASRKLLISDNIRELDE